MRGKILLVDDEPAVREMIALTLSRAGFQHVAAGDTDEAEAELGRETPDLILLDWQLPGRSGVEFARELRDDRATRDIPIIMLTARGGEDDKVESLGQGADDHITKPFAPRELVARIEAVLRRSRRDATQSVLTVGDLTLDPGAHRVMAGDTALNLAPTEYRLLKVFMSHPDRVYSRSHLLDLVWRENLDVGERTVDMHVSNLRKALEACELGHLIQTVRGVGYRLSEVG